MEPVETETVTGECIQLLDADDIGGYRTPREADVLVEKLDGYLAVIKLREESLTERFWPIRLGSSSYIRDVVLRDADFDEGDEVALNIETLGENLHIQAGTIWRATPSEEEIEGLKARAGGRDS